MALVLLDRVRESTTTTGTGTVTLLGAIAGFQSFAAIGNGNQTYYTIVDGTAGTWEVGIGTYTSSGTTLSRTTVLSSSNGGALVPFGAGAKDVFVTYPAEKAIYEEPDGDTIINAGPITVIGPGVSTPVPFAETLGRFYGNQPTFQQIYVQNQNDDAEASADVVAYNDLGDGATNFIDMGISSSNYSSPTYPIFTAGSGYVYNDGGELIIGSGSAHDVVLFAGGVDLTDEAVRISNTDKSVTAVGDVSVGGALDVTGAATFGSTVLLNADPTLALQAATKAYVDNAVTAGLHIHEPVRVETTGNLTATYVQGGTTFNITDITSGTTVTTSASHGLVVNNQIWLTTTAGNGLSTNTAYFVYSTPAANQLTLSLTFGGAQITGLTNATGLTYATRANSGVGATLTNSGAQAALVVDGVTMVVADRVMVRLQTNGAENGVYVVTNVGSGATNWILTRANDANQVNPNDPDGLGTGDYFFTREGLLNAGDSHVLTTEPNTMIIGYTTLTYTQFSGQVDYVGGTNIDITGQVISLTGTVAATNGGTGVNTVTTGDLLYGSASNTWASLPLGSAYKSLVVNGAGTQVEWNAVSLSAAGAVSGSLPATNGGTGLNSYATGDLIYSPSTNTLTVLSGNTSTTKQFLSQIGTGSASAAPVWGTIAATDVSGLAASATTDTTNADNISSGTLPSGRLIGAYTQVTGVGTLTSGTWNATAIASGYGGTGFTTYATGDLIYASATNTLSKLAAGTNGYVLTLAGGVPTWAAGGGGGASPATPTTLGTVYGNTGNGTSTFFASLGYNASAGGANSVSVGTNSSSGGADGVAVGRGSNAGGQSAVGVGKFSVSTGVESVAMGQQATATQNRATAIGAVSTAGAANATALGAGANASYANNIVISGTGNLIAANTGVFIDSMRDESAGSPDKTLKYNTTTKEIFYGTGGGGGGSANPEATNGIYVNSNTISTNYTVATGFNGMSSGPVTIDSGISVTVADGSRWVVL
jgi:hypothetical protein